MIGDLTEFETEKIINELEDQQNRAFFLFQYNVETVYEISCSFQSVIATIKNIHNQNIVLDLMEKTIEDKQAKIQQLNKKLAEKEKTN